MDDMHKFIGKFMNVKSLVDNMPIRTRKKTRHDLADLFRELGYRHGVEIGTQKGNYAMVLCDKNPNLFLTCIDPWMAYNARKQKNMNIFYRIALRNLKPYMAQHKLAIIRDTSLQAVKKFKRESIDFCFIDGNHEFDYVVRDIIHWNHKVRKGGIMACHDYLSFYRGGVLKAVDAYIHCHNIYPWFVTSETTPTAFWVKQ